MLTLYMEIALEIFRSLQRKIEARINISIFPKERVFFYIPCKTSNFKCSQMLLDFFNTIISRGASLQNSDNQDVLPSLERTFE